MAATGQVKQDRVVVAGAQLRAQRRAEPETERFHARMSRLSAVAKRARRDEDLWCILRTSPNRTLGLTLALVGQGFEAWTPAEVRTWRRGRSRTRVDRDIAMMPGFVFVSGGRATVLELHAASALPVSPYPPFSIFLHGGRVPLLSGSAFRPLRDAETAAIDAAAAVADQERLEAEKAALREQMAHARATVAQQRAAEKALLAARRQERRPFQAGQAVRIDRPEYAGLTGTVTVSGDRHAWVQIGAMTMKVETWQLLPDAVSGRPSPEDMAALAA